MFERIANSFALARSSWHVLMSNKKLVTFPILSGIACLIVLASFVTPIALLAANGNIQFDPAGLGSTVFTNTPLPNTNFGTTIFPFWDDLQTDRAFNGIFTKKAGSGANQKFIIEWRASDHLNATPVNFALVFLKGKTRFQVFYGESNSGGNSATAGVQSAAGEQFTFSRDAGLLTSSHRVDYIFHP